MPGAAFAEGGVGTRADATLEGRSVLVTRARARAADLMSALRSRGATPVLAPAIRIVAAPRGPLHAAIERLAAGAYDWVVLTSSAGVEALAASLDEKGLGFRAVDCSVAAVGEGTAAALRARGVDPALVPERYTTAALGHVMPEGPGRMLLARADIAPSGLEAVLEAKGWTCDRVEAYRTRLSRTIPERARRLLADGALDALTFTSASTVRGFLGVAGSILEARGAGVRPAKVVCIGPVTASAAREAGLPVDAEAHPHTIEGLVEALERTIGPSGP